MVLPAVCHQSFFRAIRRAVIDNDHFRGERIWKFQRVETRQQLLQARGAIEGRDNNSYRGKFRIKTPRLLRAMIEHGFQRTRVRTLKLVAFFHITSGFTRLRTLSCDGHKVL